MAPQLQGWVSWSRLPQRPPLRCPASAQRRRVLRLAPPRRGAGTVRVVAEVGPLLAVDRGPVALEIQLPNEEEEESVGERERLRRMRISQANKGNTPWNKGRKHSPETLQRIRERTRIAMQDPKVKKKLMNLGHSQSEETRIKISLGVRQGWRLRLHKLMVQDGCIVEWQDMIADAARKGFAGGVALHWNSYKFLSEQMRQQWLEKLQKKKSMPRPTGNRRAPKTPEQRRKIAEAIAAKWLDHEYRERVCSGIASYHGTSVGARIPRKSGSPTVLGTKREPTKQKTIQQKNSRLEDPQKAAKVKRKKSSTPYRDPMAGEKLEMITKIRVQRAALEIEKKEAIKKARSLIAEAEKAANALETVAATSPFAQASLVEARKLVTKARLSLESVNNCHGESASVDTSKDSAVSEMQNYNSENRNDMIKQEKPVNGMKFPPSIVNGMDFYFDVPAFSETQELSVYQRTENSIERAYLLPSAFSTLQDINGNLGQKKFHAIESMLHESGRNGQIEAETTGNCPAEAPEEIESSPMRKSKMRWLRGRLVEVEE